MGLSAGEFPVAVDTAIVRDGLATELTAKCNAFVGDSGTGGAKGMVPAPAAGDAAANKYLNADGTWKAVVLADGSITNIKISASAAIDVSKLGTGGTIPANSGVNLTALNASNLSSGTVATARLSSNVPLKDGTNAFTGTQNFDTGASTVWQLTGSILSIANTGLLKFYSGNVAGSGAGSVDTILKRGGAGALGVYLADGITEGTLRANLDAGFIVAGTVAPARLGNLTPDSTKWLRGDSQWTAVTIAATGITSGTIATARLGSGTANSGTFLRGDQTWAAVSVAAEDLGGAGLPALDGSALTNLSGSALAGSVDAGLLINALPVLNGSALTNLTAGNLQGTYPALDGSAIISLTGSQLANSGVSCPILSTSGVNAGADTLDKTSLDMIISDIQTKTNTLIAALQSMGIVTT